MKSDFIFVLTAFGTIVCVTCAHPISSSEIQPDRGKNNLSIAKDLLALLDKADDTQEDQKFENDNAKSAKAEDFRKISRKIKDLAGRLRGLRPTDSGGTVPAPEFTYIPAGGSLAKPDEGQGYSRGGVPTRGGGGGDKYQSHIRSRGPARDLGGVSAPEFTYIRGGGQGAQAEGNGYRIRINSSQLYGDSNNNMRAKEQIAIVGTILGTAVSVLAPYAVDVVHKVGQVTGRAIKRAGNFIFNRKSDSEDGQGYRYTDEYPDGYPDGPPPRYPQGPPEYAPPPHYDDPSSNEDLLERELLRVANEQAAAPFRRTSFIKNPDEWKLKPNYKRGFFETIKQFFKNLYQSK